MKRCCRIIGIVVVGLVILCESTPTSSQERVKRQMSISSAIPYDQAPAKNQLQQQGLPIIGALLPASLLGNLVNGLSSLVPLGNLGNLANLGNFGNLGSLLPGIGLPQTQQNQCPLGQISRCRCENVLPLSSRMDESLEIIQQRVSLNVQGEKELTARLSNGLLLFQRSGKETVSDSNGESAATQGYYTLPINANKYLTIYYTFTDSEYTVKADVTSQPPKNDLDVTPPLVLVV
uniref:Uncharacterized protein n=1 Tax=Stomoxys calcitrans TaxID=35570 RepID=A0A1I8NZ15_STOCA